VAGSLPEAPPRRGIQRHVESCTECAQAFLEELTNVPEAADAKKALDALRREPEQVLAEVLRRLTSGR
jgi:hypothetical protein